RNENADRKKTDGSKILTERSQQVPRPTGELHAVGDHAGRFDSADDDCDENGHQRDDHVVIELAHGLDEGPTVSAEHEYAVGRVEQRHTGGKEEREDENRRDGKAFAGFHGGNAEKPNLSSGIEAEAEEYSDGIHFPALVGNLEQRTKEAAGQSAAVEHAVEVTFAIAFAATDSAKRAKDLGEHEQV